MSNSILQQNKFKSTSNKDVFVRILDDNNVLIAKYVDIDHVKIEHKTTHMISEYVLDVDNFVTELNEILRSINE